MSEEPLILTPSQTTGPMFGFALVPSGGEPAVAVDDPGALRIDGVLYDGRGPLAAPDGLVEAWEGEQYARSRTDEAGGFGFTVRKPAPRRLPDGTPLAPHLTVVVFGRGLQKQAPTLMYFPDEAEANAADPILARVDAGRRHTLIAEAVPGGLRFDIRLQGEGETVFFDF